MSNLVEHAKRELDILAKSGDPDDEMHKVLIECVAKFAEYGHSGSSALWASQVLEKLLRFKNLTPLTENLDEWMLVGYGVWQSVRDPEAFSNDAGDTYYLLSNGSNLNNPWPRYKSAKGD